MHFLRLLALVAALACLLVLARDARAEPAGPRAVPVFVLGLDTDDAEEQADALTDALRSRVRVATGWSLSETTQTLSMLSAALRCPRQPDATCLSRIAEQLKTSPSAPAQITFIWGTVQKAPGNMVKADVHLWSKNKPEQHVTDTYAENLTVHGDDRLQVIARRLFERLTGTVSTGTLAVHAGEGTGVVLVDGQRRGTLDKGEASLELPAGNHVVEVRVQGYTWSRDSVNVVAGKEARLTVNLVSSEAPPSTTSSGPSGRKIAGWATFGVGGALLIAGGIHAILYLGKSGEQSYSPPVDKLNNPGDVKDIKHIDPCAVSSSDTSVQAQLEASCTRSKDAKAISTRGIVFAATGAVATAVGLYLVLTDAGAEKPAPKFEDRVAKPRVRIVPAVSPMAQGLLVEGVF